MARGAVVGLAFLQHAPPSTKAIASSGRAPGRPPSQACAHLAQHGDAAPRRRPTCSIQPAPSFAVSARARGPEAATYSRIGSRGVDQPEFGVEQPDLPPLALDLGLDRLARATAPCTTRMYSSISSSFIAPSPIARRPVKPVPTPKSIRPGASLFSEAKALAVTAAMPVRRDQHPGAEPDAAWSSSPPRAIATNSRRSASGCRRTRRGVKPSSSARRTSRQLFGVGRHGDAEIHYRFSLLPGAAKRTGPAGASQAGN